MFSRSVRKQVNDAHTHNPQSSAEREFALERYRYLLNQINNTNENVHRFLAIYQTLATALVGGCLALFVGYRRWGIPAPTARSTMIGAISLITVVALFTILLIAAGIANWIDYRREECELTDQIVRPGFRKPPNVQNFFRWYETYIVMFILGSIAFLWIFVFLYTLPAMS
jgi:uncharacterized iron-regulated membrane protein